MPDWTSNELDKIGNAEEVEISTLRRDGTLRKPVTIWVVRVGNDLYVRSWLGHNGAWYRNAQARPEGKIQAGGVTKDVSFVGEADPAINARIDAARLDTALVAGLSAAKPGAIAPVHRPDVEVVAEADDPNRHRLSQRAVTFE